MNNFPWWIVPPPRFTSGIARLQSSRELHSYFRKTFSSFPRHPRKVISSMGDLFSPSLKVLSIVTLWFEGSVITTASFRRYDPLLRPLVVQKKLFLSPISHSNIRSLVLFTEKKNKTRLSVMKLLSWKIIVRVGRISESGNGNVRTYPRVTAGPDREE